MITKYDFAPVLQTGHNCKTVAIAAIDQYYGKLLDYPYFPLHKAKKHAFSIRQLAKRKGSVQGELLEIQQITDCFSDLAYETKIIKCHDVNHFQKSIQENLTQGNLMIGFFSVDRTSGQPSSNYVNNEHAAVIHGLEGENLVFTHWNKKYQSSVHDFFHSSQALPKQRKPEYYQNPNNGF